MMRPTPNVSVDSLLPNLHGPGFGGDQMTADFLITLNQWAAPLDVRRPVAAVGLSGQLPPNAILVVTPYEHRECLLAATSGVVPDLMWRGLMQSVVGVPTRPMTPPIQVVRAGTTLHFGEVLRHGISAVLLSPWAGLSTLGDVGFHSSASGVDGVDGAAEFVPQPAGIVRTWAAGAVVPPGIGYVPVPISGPIPVAAALPSSPPAGMFFCGGATRYITIQPVDDVDPLASYSGGACDMQVYFYTTAGLWAHNAADDWVAGQRGQVSTTHDLEVYAVPNTVVAVALTSATVTYAQIAAAE